MALTTRGGSKRQSSIPAGNCPISDAHSSSRDARALSVMGVVLAAGVVVGITEEAAGMAAEEEVVDRVARKATDLN